MGKARELKRRRERKAIRRAKRELFLTTHPIERGTGGLTITEQPAEPEPTEATN